MSTEVSLVHEIGVISLVSIVGVVYVSYEVGLVSAISVMMMIIIIKTLTFNVSNAYYIAYTVCKLIVDT